MKKSKKFRYGSFATLLTLGVLVIAIAVNVAVNLLGQRVTLRLDTTASSAFNISEEVDELRANLDQPVTIYVLNDEANFVAGGTGNSAAKDPSFTQANEVFKYFANANDQITLQYVNMVRDPNFQSQFSDLTLQQNDVLVVSGDRKMQISSVDLFNTQVVANSYLRILSSKAENALASAILVVTSENTTKVSLLTGHNEYDATSVTELLGQNNYTVKSQNIGTEAIDPEADAVIIYGPSTDYSPEEIEKLDAFLQNGGQYGKTVFYFAANDQPELPNLEAFLEEWGIIVEPGVAFENGSNFIIQDQFNAVNVLNSDSVYTENCLNKGKVPYIPYCRPLTAAFKNSGSRSTTMLIRMSADSGIIPPDADKNASITDFVTGYVPIMLLGQNKVEVGGEQKTSNVVVCGSVYYGASEIIQNSAFANADFLVELTGTLTGRDSQVIIAPKDMAAKYLDIASDGASFMRILFIGVLPVGCLAVGAFVFLRRRHL